MGKSGSLPRWQLCRGISGSFRVEWVAGFVWNQWQPWSGIRTRPVKLQGIHQSHFDTAAKASLERSTVKYTARRLKQGASKKEVLSLVSLDIIEPSPEDFSLT
jgi:hypothetical protein